MSPPFGLNPLIQCGPGRFTLPMTWGKFRTKIAQPMARLPCPRGMNTKLALLLALGSTMLVPAFAADLDIEIRLGRSAPPPPPEVIMIDQAGSRGPQSWTNTPSRWYHRSYDYYFYPEAGIYYRPSDRTWFYLEGRTWRSVRQLPPGLRVDFGRSVSLKLDSDRPYTYHDRVVASYPSSYFSHVKFKNDRDNRNDRHDGPGKDNDRRDDKDHGRDDRGNDRRK